MGAVTATIYTVEALCPGPSTCSICTLVYRCINGIITNRADEYDGRVRILLFDFFVIGKYQVFGVQWNGRASMHWAAHPDPERNIS
jgi:hypothetical protein